MTAFARIVLLAACVAGVLASAEASAQPAAEIFVGYSYLRADTGTTDLEGGGTAEIDSANTHGTELSGSWYPNGRVGFEVSFGYNQGSFSLEGVRLPDTELEIASADATQWTFLAGPRLRLMNTPRHTFDVRALVGGANLDIRVPVSVSSFKNESFGFAATFGAAYTVVLGEAFSYRVIQPDVLISTAGPGTGVNFRLSTGIVFRR